MVRPDGSPARSVPILLFCPSLVTLSPLPSFSSSSSPYSPSPPPLLLPPSFSSSSSPSSLISNFVEDSFSSDDFQKLQIVTVINTKDDSLSVLKYKCYADNPSASLPPARQNPSFNTDAPVPSRSRSKRRTAACNWSLRLVVLSPTMSSLGSSDAIAGTAEPELQPRRSGSPSVSTSSTSPSSPIPFHLPFFPFLPSGCARPGPRLSSQARAWVLGPTGRPGGVLSGRRPYAHP